MHKAKPLIFKHLIAASATKERHYTGENGDVKRFAKTSALFLAHPSQIIDFAISDTFTLT